MPVKLTTDTFVARAKEAHGVDRYDYSHVVYKNSDTNVMIGCNKCQKTFGQRPHNHLHGAGCPSCGLKRRIESQTSTTDEFVKRAKDIHGSKYCYDKVKYLKSSTPVEIGCNTCQETFWQKPLKHVNARHGCPTCGGTRKKDTNVFVEGSQRVHGDRYDYSRVLYVASDKEVEIGCRVHGYFRQVATVHLKGHGCWKCANVLRGPRRITANEFLRRAFQQHGERYTYDMTTYTMCSADVHVVCPLHGTFHQLGTLHLQGHGCPTCGAQMPKRVVWTIEAFIERAKAIHQDKYNYLSVCFTSIASRITIQCPKHGQFEQRVEHHLRGCGCPTCSKAGTSKISLEWLSVMRVVFACDDMMTFATGGEYKLNGVGKLDGYSVGNNIAFEFHGDYWHGNPTRFDPSDVFHDDKTFGDLYRDTISRDQKIREYGIELVVMWESEWKCRQRLLTEIRK